MHTFRGQAYIFRPSTQMLSAQVCSLGRRLSSLLADLQHCQARCPRLVAALRATVARQQAHASSHSDRSFDAISGSGGRMPPRIQGCALERLRDCFWERS
eukprot:scaffold164102_cov21-Tisochrysis_lutea.AAC.3